jgi:hypothetical protein
MSKRGYESAALVGFDIVVPGAGAKAEPAPPGEAPEATGGFEDSWYRTLRVTAGAGDGVEREGALGEPTASGGSTAPDPLAVAHEPAPVQRVAASQPAPPAPNAEPVAPSGTGQSSVAAESSAHSYEDSWYQILKGRQVAQGE